MAAFSSRAMDPNEQPLLGRGAPFAGKYAVERVLGQGGMGTVFEARHLRLGHRVAIKVLGSELRDYPELVTRFEREARAAGALKSRHAVRVFDIDVTEDATPFIVMELLAGCDLSRILDRDGAQPIGRAVRWVIEACDAIAEAHSLGIIHRDIKPSNLFLTDEGVKVLDFGVAKRVASKEAAITHAVAPLGTPQYMSPEQVRCAKDVDARTDVWSLGVTLFELVTGTTPYPHESPSACIASIAADPVPDPRTLRADLPDGLAEIILRALEKDPDARIASVAALVSALAPFAETDANGEMAAEVKDVLARVVAVDRADRATLDHAEIEAQQASPAPVPVPPIIRIGDSQGDVPPAVSHASVRPRRRWRPSIAIASAAALGLMALVMTPRCAATFDSASRPTVSTPRTAKPIPAVEVAPSHAAAETTPANAPPSPADRAAVDGVDSTVDLDAPKPVQAATPSAQAAAKPTAKPTATVTMAIATAPSASPKTLTASKKTPKTSASSKPDDKAKIVANDSPVHGGLSSPGF